MLCVNFTLRRYQTPPSSTQPIKESIITADAEYPSILFKRGDITFKYIDWQEKERTIVFSEVAGFKWQDEIDLGFPERDDMPYEVINSKWIKELQELGVFGDSATYKHYKLCFNACGVLDVVFAKLELKNEISE